jgi:phosphomannomutase
MRDVVLFDMDGTVTPVRQTIEQDMVLALDELGRFADVGIVSGSNYDYMSTQLDGLTGVTLLPCNGTKVYTCDGITYSKEYDVDMKQEITPRVYRLLIRTLLQLQSELLDSLPELPLTGHFISDRGSLVNWCPIGREANPEQRKAFVELDREHAIRPRMRARLLEGLAGMYQIRSLVVALGGDTSFDIYPTGWDKTYSLRHFEGRKVWFMGDKCGEGGNDKALFDYVQEKWESGFWVSGPEETLRNVRWLIRRLARRKK